MIQRNNGLEPRPAPCCVPVLRTGRNKEAKPGGGTGAGPPGQAKEAFAHQGVKGRILREPLARQGFAEPEDQNLAGLFSLVWHQSNACTLATLSSRVWSLSVRVLTFTVTPPDCSHRGGVAYELPCPPSRCW